MVTPEVHKPEQKTTEAQVTGHSQNELLENKTSWVTG